MALTETQSEQSCVLVDPQNLKRKQIDPKLHCLSLGNLLYQRMNLRYFGRCSVFYSFVFFNIRIFAVPIQSIFTAAYLFLTIVIHPFLQYVVPGLFSLISNFHTKDLHLPEMFCLLWFCLFLKAKQYYVTSKTQL